LWSTPTKSSTLTLPFLVPMHTRLVAYVQFAAVCTAPARWMTEGCQFIQANLSKANLYLSRSLPALLTADAKKLETAGADPSLIARLRTAIAAPDLARAVALHDQAVVASDGGVTP